VAGTPLGVGYPAGKPQRPQAPGLGERRGHRLQHRSQASPPRIGPHSAALGLGWRASPRDLRDLS
jgi:hypothetical protein